MSVEDITKGMKLTAAFGDSFFAAEVLEVSTAKKRAKAPIKVHYIGYGAEEDAWVSLDQIKSKALKAAGGKKAKGKEAKAAPAKEAPKAAAGAVDFSVLEKGSKLTALFTDGKWYGATVVEVSKAKKKAKAPVKVHYNGYGDDEDAWVGADGLRSKLLKKAPAAKAKEPEAKAADGAVDYSVLAKGTKLTAQFTDGTWYAATVVEVSKAKKQAKAPVKVHFNGYGDDEDAWVGADKLRCKALKAAPAGKGAKKEEKKKKESVLEKAEAKHKAAQKTAKRVAKDARKKAAAKAAESA